MIVTSKKPNEEILKVLSPYKKIFIIGCGECATICETGGNNEVQEMKKILEDNGKEVTGFSVPQAPCSAGEVTITLAKNRKEITDADVFLVLSCGLGAQSLLDNDRTKKPVCIGCNTMGGAVTDKTGKVFSEKCSMCGECVINVTGGICPVTMCAKGLLNGPCGGADKGKCEVDKDRDCAWILIYNRLKDLNMLDNMREIKPPKDYSIGNKPRKTDIGRKV